MSQMDDAFMRLNAERTAENAGREQRQWADVEALKVVRRYVRSLRTGGVPPLRVGSPEFVREDWTEREGGLFSRTRVRRHRWKATFEPSGQAWLVTIGNWVTVKRGERQKGADGPGPDTMTPAAVVYDLRKESAFVAVLPEVTTIKRSTVEGWDYEQTRTARIAWLEPREIVGACEYCRGACGLPVWVTDNTLRHLSTMVSSYLSRHQAHHPPPGTGTAAYDFYVGNLLRTLDGQLRREGVTWRS